jgi:MFS family permease
LPSAARLGIMLAMPDLAAPLTASRPAGSPLRAARAALILLLAINLFNYVDRSILFSLAETIRGEFNVSKAAMGWLVTAFLVTYMLLSPLFGWLADRFRRWALIGVGVILWSLASGASGLAQTYIMLLLMRCLIGVGEAAYGPIAPTLIADLYPVAQRGKVLSWFYCAIPVGSALGYMLGGFFAHPGKWHHAFLLTIPPGLLLGALCFFFREPPRGAADGAVSQRKLRLADYLALARIKSYTINTAAMTAMTFAIGGVAAWMPTYLTADRHLSPETANLGLGAIVVVAGLIATLAGGITGDRLRGRFPGSYFLVSGFGMLAGFPLFLLVLVTPFPYAWFVTFAAVFCLFFNTGPSNTALANVAPPAVRAGAFAVNILIIHALGDAISPPVIGLIADHYSMAAGFAVISVTMAVGGVLWLWGARFLPADTAAAPHRLQTP